MFSMKNQFISFVVDDHKQTTKSKGFIIMIEMGFDKLKLSFVSK